MMWWSVSPFAADEELDATVTSAGEPAGLKLGMHAPETYRGDTARALADTKGWLADGWAQWLMSRRRTARPPARSRSSAVRGSRPVSTPT
ncbi:Transcription-repair coupling factor OS=Streptomyces microflavus OX=1919 GN=Smic_30350 PE=4 SV=1 [Streptomyces microflavus]